MKKRLYRVLASLLVVCLISGLVPEGTFFSSAKEKSSVKSISLEKPIVNTLLLKKGEKYNLKVKVLPTKEKSKIKYVSSKRSVVVISKKGKISAKKVGTALITVKSTTKPVKQVSIKVKVTAKLEKVKKISVNGTKEIKVGDTTQLICKLSPKTATSKKLIYKTSDKSILDVNQSGLVTGKKVGSAKISVYAADGRGAKKDYQICVVSKEENMTEKPKETNIPQGTEQPKGTDGPKGTEQPKETPNTQDLKDSFVFANGSETTSIYIDKNGNDYDGLNLVAKSFASDINLVTKEDVSLAIITNINELSSNAIIAGSIGNNNLIDQLIKDNKIDITNIKNKTEVYQIQVVDNPTETLKKAVVVVGSDKRGTIYGLYHISELLGVSPWAYWGDATPEKRDKVSLLSSELAITSKEPTVKYRGIFLNDEAPSLTGWVKNEFGNYNEEFYEKVYELLLRLKGNYLWPAMWSNNFSTDGKVKPLANAELADKYGIIMGTSHHEPMCRAGEEWKQSYKNYGSSSEWDFNANGEAITKFWDDGVKRNKSFENIYTLGMRGESDSSLEGTVEDNITLLKNVITTQKNILKNQGVSDAPQVLTVYKEVEDMWNGTEKQAGLKNWDGLNDVTVMFCDDNFGNMRTLPKQSEKNRAAGYGMYYHFDYHGGPTSYEWVNSVQVNKVWEQMTMAYEYGVDNIWIVNVGDLKPMELNVSYFLDLAYDYEKYSQKEETQNYESNWLEQQFDSAVSSDVKADMKKIYDEYTWLNSSCKAECLTSATYDVTNYAEAKRMLSRVEKIITLAEDVMKKVPSNKKAAYYELVYFPAVASANVAKIQIYSGFNEYCFNNNLASTNMYAERLEAAIEKDRDLEYEYNNNIPGVGDKWKYMMSSPHVGFVTWNSSGWSYPQVKRLAMEGDTKMTVVIPEDQKVYTSGTATLPDMSNGNQENYTIELSNQGGSGYSYQVSTNDEWIVLAKTKGFVTMYDSFNIAVDWSKVSESKTGSITITGNEQTIYVNVKAIVTDVSKMVQGTYVYGNGYASMLAKSYTASQKGVNGEECQTIENYGKMGAAVRAFPSYTNYVDNPSGAPYVEYSVDMPEAGEYNLTSYTAPSNNIDSDSVTIRYGVSVNSGNISVINSIDSEKYSPGAYSGTWTKDVKVNGRMTESKVALQKGINKLRYYFIEPSYVLQKVVISKEKVKTSHFGPTESFYVGKSAAKEDLSIPSIHIYSLPGTINAAGYAGSNNYEAKEITAGAGEEYTYSAIISDKADYSFMIYGSSDNQAEVQLSWNDIILGTVKIQSAETLYSVENTSELECGKGELKLKVVSGDVSFSTIKVRSKIDCEWKTISVTASSEMESNKALASFDKETLTSWKPEETDNEKWLEFDFDDLYQIDRFAITGKGIKSYKVQVYDGKQYKEIYTTSSMASGAYVFIQGKEKISAQKVRFSFVGDDVQVSEIDLTPYINWATDGKVALSGTKNNGEEYSVPESIVDGDRITKGLVYGSGSSTDSNRHRLTMAFDQARTIDTVRIFSLQENEDSAPGSGVIPDKNMTSEKAQYSYRVLYEQGGSWYEIGATLRPTSGNPKVFSEFVLDTPVLAQAIKVEIYTSNWIRVNELEAVQSYPCIAAEPVGTKEYTEAENVYEIELNAAVSVDKIISYMSKPTKLSYEYYDDESGIYKEIADQDIDQILTDDTCQAIPGRKIITRRLRVSSEDAVNITKIEVYKSYESNSNTILDLLYEGFENGTGIIGNWGSAGLETTKDEAYSGKRSLSVNNRTGDACCPVINLSKYYDSNNTSKVYTLSFYIKTVTNDIPFVMKICNQAGKDYVASDVITVKKGDWNYVTFQFSLENSDYKYLKLQTEGDVKDDKEKYTSFYIDELRLNLPSEKCTCELGTPQITNDKDISIAYGKNKAAVNLTSKVQSKECKASGHDSQASYRYYIMSDKDNIATISGDELTVTGEGKVTVRVTAQLNGQTRYGMCEFTATKVTQMPATYKNYALASNGGELVVSAGGSGAVINLNDGVLTSYKSTSNERWRSNVLPAYIEVHFDGLKEIDKVYIYAQQDGEEVQEPTNDMTSSYASNKLKFSYMKDGQWVEFENGLIENNNLVKAGVTLNESIQTPAIRIDIIKAASDGWARLIEVEAYGSEVESQNCICQLGSPVLTSNNLVEIEKGKTKATLQLDAESIFYSSGCGKEGHKEEKPKYSFEIEKDLQNIANIEENILTVHDVGIVEVKVVASMNGKTVSDNFIINVTKAGYINVALASNGSVATSSVVGDADVKNIIDGDNSFANGKRWRTQTYPNYVEIDFSQTRLIDCIDLFSQQESGNVAPDYEMTTKYAPDSFTISYWDREEETWTLFENGEVTNNNLVWYKLKLDEAIETSKIRIDVSKSVSDGWWRVVEVEAWGNNGEEQEESNFFDLDLSKCATNGYSNTAPTATACESGMQYSFTTTNQKLFLELTEQQIAKVAAAESITIQIIGTSSVVAQFRMSLANPAAGSNWNGTTLETIASATNISTERTFTFANSAKTNTVLLKAFMLQMQSAATPDVQLASVRITCN